MGHLRAWLIKVYAWACERLYHEMAWVYDLVSWLVSAGRWTEWRRSALGYLPQRAGLRVLEIGFGTGELLLELAQQERAVYGLELSPAMHAVTRYKSRSRGINAAVVQARAQAMPLAAAQFDAILATFPAPYILEPVTLAECARALRIGGRLIIAGLWVSVEPAAFARMLPLFYGDLAPELREEIARRMAEVGLDARVHCHADGPFRIGVIVAQKSEGSVQEQVR